MKDSKGINKKTLKAKMAVALNDNISTLSSEMRNILVDDLICAFENRLKILSKADSNVNLSVNIEDIEIVNPAL